MLWLMGAKELIFFKSCFIDTLHLTINKKQTRKQQVHWEPVTLPTGCLAALFACKQRLRQSWTPHLHTQ